MSQYLVSVSDGTTSLTSHHCCLYGGGALLEISVFDRAFSILARIIDMGLLTTYRQTFFTTWYGYHSNFVIQIWLQNARGNTLNMGVKYRCDKENLRSFENVADYLGNGTT